MKIKIMRCTDSLCWYSKDIGETFEVIKSDQYYWCYDNDGYSNVVHKKDAVIVEGETK